MTIFMGKEEHRKFTFVRDISFVYPIVKRELLNIEDKEEMTKR